MNARQKQPGPGPLPSKDDVIAYIRQSPQTLSKRDLGRAFKIKGDNRAPFKAMLRELVDDGILEKPSGKKYSEKNALPKVCVIDLIEQDTDGELIGVPVRWERDEPPPKIRLHPGGLSKLKPAIGIGERVLARIGRDDEGRPVAKLMKRVGASAHEVLGVVRRSRDGPRVIPVDRKSRHELKVSTADLKGARADELVVCEVEPDAGRAGLRRARIKERIGPMDAPGAISLISIHGHRLRTVFPEAALNEARSAKPVVLGNRDDLRDLAFITIDPSDARDHDDAVFAEQDNDPANKGGFHVWVAIADVAHFVRFASALDSEAIKRGNSTYFPDRVVPMLPEELSAGLCSLQEGQDRPSLAVKMTLRADGTKKSHKFVRALIRSAAKMSYEEAQAAMDGKVPSHLAGVYETALVPLFAAYRVMAEARDKRAPLDLDLPEHKISFDDGGKVGAVKPKERLETMRLIEEMMIAANVAAAETLERQKAPLLYRIHDQPDLEKLENLKTFIEGLDLKFGTSGSVKPGHFNRLIKSAKDTDVEPMLHEVILRSQSQARYSPDNVGHFGLNLARYAHFTSPIRRYADLVVHRALIRSLKLGDDGLTDAQGNSLGDLGEALSTLERRSMAAERDATDRYLTSYLADRVGAQFQGRIAGVTRFGLFVKLSETGADGIVPIRSLGNDYFFHDESAHALIGETSGATYKLGEPVEVKLLEAAPITGGLVFELLNEPLSFTNPKKIGRKPKNAKRPTPRNTKPKTRKKRK